MEVRFFSQPRPDTADQHGLLRAVDHQAADGGRALLGRRRPANPPQAKSRSLLARLLGGDVEAGSYSSAENSFPAPPGGQAFSFPVLALDVAVSPKDKIPRMVVSDGDKVYMYRIVEQKFEPEWTKSVRGLGRVFSVQLADLDGDGSLEVIGNRYAPKRGLNSFILTTKDGKPQILLEDISEFLFAVDLTGTGVKQTLWSQRFSPIKFFTPGPGRAGRREERQARDARIGAGAAAFRPMGAAFSNITGKDTRALAFIDENNRLQMATEGEELWRSSSSVGGGYMELELEYGGGWQRAQQVLLQDRADAAGRRPRRGRDRRARSSRRTSSRRGCWPWCSRAPPAYRLQSVNTGFEGGITALGAFRTEDSTQPTLIAHRGALHQYPEDLRRDPGHHDRAAGVVRGHVSTEAREQRPAGRIVLTYDDYCDLPDDGRRYEILDGELAVTPSPDAVASDVCRQSARRPQAVRGRSVPRGGLHRSLRRDPGEGFGGGARSPVCQPGAARDRDGASEWKARRI